MNEARRILREALRDRDFLRMLGIWAFFCTLTELIDFYIVPGAFPFLAAKQGEESDYAIFILLLYVGANYFFIAIPIVYAVNRWRRRGRAGDAEHQSRSNRLFPFFWVGYATVMAVTAISFPGITGLLSIWQGFFKGQAANAANSGFVVDVNARQWEWDISYPQYGVSTVDKLALIDNQLTDFRIRSLDVEHSFWVPAFRIKFDAVPGETRDLFLTPDKLASTKTSEMLRVQCAELCGVGHADMQATVQIFTHAGFMKWIAQQKAMAKRQKKLSTQEAKKLQRQQQRELKKAGYG